jgi:pyruvate dehydrogenase E1 component beta subunit
VIFIEHAQLYFAGNKEVVPVPGVPIPIGKANIRREGTDVSIIAYSRAAVLAEEAAEQLAAEGISAEVLDLRTISPLDMPGVLASVAKTRRALIAHESVAPFGAGAEIATRINEELFGHLLAPVSRVTSQNCPVPYSRPLEDAYLLATEDIVTAARGVVASKDSVWQQL